MRFHGTLTTWHDDRGFGFITPTDGGDELFVHIKAFARSGGRPQLGQSVSFVVEPGPQGKKRAKQVEFVRQTRPAQALVSASPAKWGTATLFAIPVFAVVCLVVSIVWKPSPLWLAVYGGMSILTFLVYAVDKSAAVQGRWRTPENTLHLLALAGGWPGALLAQQYLRHKSTKAEFRTAFWATAVLNALGFVLICSPYGGGGMG